MFSFARKTSAKNPVETPDTYTHINSSPANEKYSRPEHCISKLARESGNSNCPFRESLPFADKKKVQFIDASCPAKFFFLSKYDPSAKF